MTLKERWIDAARMIAKDKLGVDEFNTEEKTMKLSDRMREEAAALVKGGSAVSGSEVARMLAKGAQALDNAVLLLIVARRKMEELQHDALADAMAKLEEEIVGNGDKVYGR